MNAQELIDCRLDNTDKSADEILEKEGFTKSLKGAKDPQALAASIGRKVHGKKKFQAMAAKGKKGK